MGMDQLPELILPSEAVRRLEKFCGGPIAAKEWIADKIREGEIRAYALKSWVSDDKTLKIARRLRRELPQTKQPIEVKKIMGAESWGENVRSWDWKKAVFHSVIRSRPMRRRIFYRVRLAADDVEAIIHEHPHAVQRKVSNRGRPPKLQAWEKVWRAMLVLAMDGQMSKDRFPKAAHFRQAVLEKAFGTNKDRVSEGTEALEKLVDGTVGTLLNDIYQEFVEGRDLN